MCVYMDTHGHVPTCIVAGRVLTILHVVDGGQVLDAVADHTALSPKPGALGGRG